MSLVERNAATRGSEREGGPGWLGQMGQKGGRGPFSKRFSFLFSNKQPQNSPFEPQKVIFKK
jgi:hypothetical protein